MKVLHVISALDPKSGGPAAAIGGLAPAQVKAGLKVTVAATFRGGFDDSIARKMKDAGVNVELIGPCTGPLMRHPSLPARLHELVAAVDIVHIHALWEEIQHQAALAARQLKKPYIFRPCGMLDPWSLRQSKWKKKLYMAWRLRNDLNHAAALHFTAGMERDLTAPLHLKPPAIVEPNGIDLSEFENLPPKGTFRNRYPQFSGRPMLLFLSRIHPKKGLDILIPAFAQVLTQIANRKSQIANEAPFLVIAGPDSDGYEAKVRQMAKDHGIDEHIVFPGPLFGRDKVAAYTDADLFVLPSYQENFGIVVIEAMAAGCPVLISQNVNIHGEITSAGAGWTAELSVRGFSAGIAGRLADSGGRMTTACQGRALAPARYGWRAIAETWVRFYVATVMREQ